MAIPPCTPSPSKRRHGGETPEIPGTPVKGQPSTPKRSRLNNTPSSRHFAAAAESSAPSAPAIPNAAVPSEPQKRFFRPVTNLALQILQRQSGLQKTLHFNHSRLLEDVHFCRASNDLPGACVALNKAIACIHDSSKLVLLELLAETEIQRRQYHAALATCDTIERLKPDNIVPLLLYRSLCFIGLSHTDRAFDCAQQAALIRRDRVLVHHPIGFSEAQIADQDIVFQTVIDELLKLKTETDDVEQKDEILGVLSNIYYAIGDLDATSLILAEMNELKPASGFIYLTVLCYLTEGIRFADCIRYLSSILVHKEENDFENILFTAKLLYRVAKLQEDIHPAELACEFFKWARELVKTDKDFGTINFNICFTAQCVAKKYNEAIQTLQILKKLTPSDAAIYLDEAICFAKLGNKEDAIRSFAVALTHKDQIQNPLVDNLEFAVTALDQYEMSDLSTEYRLWIRSIIGPARRRLNFDEVKV
jgi:tetratricopeptide (TPR) repeat protein